MKRSRTTKHPWLLACDADMSPEDSVKSLWFRKDQMHVIAPEGVSTCRSKNVKGYWVEKVYDYVIACSSPEGKNSDMQVIEDFESRPHNAVIFVKEERKGRNGTSKIQPEALPGHSGGRLPEARKRKAGRKKKNA